jgi:hypothetical protein
MKAKQTVPVDKQAKLGVYLRQICKHLSEERKADNKSFTISSQAVAEAEMLIDHAINNIASNTASVLKYSGAATVDLKSVRVATKLAFAGPLRKEIMGAGEEALVVYEKATAAKPARASKAPPAAKAAN